MPFIFIKNDDFFTKTNDMPTFNDIHYRKYIVTKLKTSKVSQIKNSYINDALPAMKVHGQYITEVASRLLKGRSAAHHINQGCCLSCGTDLDIESSSTVSKNAMIQIQRYSLLITLLNFSYSNCKHLCFNRLKECIDSDEDPQILISDFLKSLSILRSVRHQYSKTIAQVGRFVCSKLLPEYLSMPSFAAYFLKLSLQAEDIIAEAFVRLGEFGPALQHCQESIEVT